MIEELLIHSAKLIRNSDVLVDENALATSVSVATDFVPVNAILEFTVTSGASVTYQINGEVDGGSDTEQIVFSGGTINIKNSTKKWSRVDSIDWVSGDTPVLTVRSITQSGQPLLAETVLQASARVRFDMTIVGFVESNTQSVVREQDRIIMYHILGRHYISQGDIVVDLDGNRRYTVINSDEVADMNGYHHSEVRIAKV